MTKNADFKTRWAKLYSEATRFAGNFRLQTECPVLCLRQELLHSCGVRFKGFDINAWRTSKQWNSWNFGGGGNRLLMWPFVVRLLVGVQSSQSNGTLQCWRNLSLFKQLHVWCACFDVVKQKDFNKNSKLEYNEIGLCWRLPQRRWLVSQVLAMNVWNCSQIDFTPVQSKVNLTHLCKQLNGILTNGNRNRELSETWRYHLPMFSSCNLPLS